MGGTLTFVDLTFASLAALAVLHPSTRAAAWSAGACRSRRRRRLAHAGGGVPGTPRGKFVLRLYREERLV